MRSFTSSSDQETTLEPRHKRFKNKKKQKQYAGWGFFGFIVLMILVEIFIFRNVMFYGYSPGFIGQLAELEATFEASEPDQIEVAIWGDSQSMDALVPEHLGAYSERYDFEQIFNFSISGGSAFDIYHTYLNYRDRLPQMKKAIVVVNEHQFNNEDPGNYILFKYYAGLQDRLRVLNKDDYGELLLGWVLKSYDMRTVWTMMLDKYRKGELRDQVPVHDSRGLPALTWSPSTDRTYEYAVEVAERWFRDYQLDGVRTDAFRKLIRDLTEAGVETTVVQIPRSKYFEEAVSTLFPEEQQAYIETIRSITEEYGAGFEIMSNEGLTIEEHFRDSNHVNPEGAVIVSKAVAEQYLDR